MHMRLVFSLIFLGFLIVGCDDGEEDRATAPAPGDEAETPAAAEPTEAPTALPDLEGRTVTIAVENGYLPFNYIPMDSDEPTGWDYEAWRAICGEINCEPKFIQHPWIGTLEEIADGTMDTAGNGISITPERREMLAFSEPYFGSEQRLMVAAGEDRFDTVQALANDPDLTVGAQQGTTNFDAAVELVGEDRVQSYATLGELLDALTAGDVAAVVVDQQAAPMAASADAQVKIIGNPIASDLLAFPFAKDSELIEPVNYALEKLEADGTLARLEQKYLSDAFTVHYDEIRLPGEDLVPYEEASKLGQDAAVDDTQAETDQDGD